VLLELVGDDANFGSVVGDRACLEVDVSLGMEQRDVGMRLFDH
jgi:hypothetical protein